MRRLSPWVVLFAVITGWHWWRDAPMDGVIFGLATALLLIESLRPGWLGTTHRTHPTGRWFVLGGVLTTTLLVLSPRYSFVTQALVIGCGLGAFRLSWFHLHRRYRAALTHRQRTAIHVWIAAATFLLGVEFAAYMGAVASHSDADFPTITVLLDPTIDHWWGRAMFSALWLLGGWALVTTRPEPNAAEVSHR